MSKTANRGRARRGGDTILPRETDTNYGIMFSFWDRLFGTYHAPDRVSVSSFGLDRLQGERWQTFPGMLLTPRHNGAPDRNFQRFFYCV